MFKINDLVEVAFNTQDGQIWHNAVIYSQNHRSITVDTDMGRMNIPRNQNRVRHLKAQPTS